MSDCAYAGPVDDVVKTTVWLTKPSHGIRIAEVTAAPFVKRSARDRRLWSAGSRSPNPSVTVALNVLSTVDLAETSAAGGAGGAFGDPGVVRPTRRETGNRHRGRQ
jgi:hypothetical protein